MIPDTKKRKMLRRNMADSSEKGEIVTKVYEYKKKHYKVKENIEFHARLKSDLTFREMYFNTQGSEEPADLIEQNEMMDVNKENFYWNNNNTKLLLHLYEERKKKFRDPKIKKKCLWTEISNEFQKHNYLNITEDILDRKMRNMKKTYRTIKDNQTSTGRGRITWDYFKIMENIFLDDKTINFGPTLSSMQSRFEPHSKKMTKQLDHNQTALSDCKLANVSSLQKTSHKKLLSEESISSYKKRIPSSNQTLTHRSSSTDSMSLSDPYNSISTEEDDLNNTHQSQNKNLSEVDMYKPNCSYLDDPQITEDLFKERSNRKHYYSIEDDASYDVNNSLQSDDEDSSEKDKYNEGTPSMCKLYSMKDGAVRSGSTYKRPRIDEEKEMERTKEIDDKDSSEKEKYNKGTPSMCKLYSMKDNAVKSRSTYKRRRTDEEKEMERTKEITELRKTFEKNNEILEKRNQLLEDYIKELKTSKNT